MRFDYHLPDYEIHGHNLFENWWIEALTFSTDVFRSDLTIIGLTNLFLKVIFLGQQSVSLI